MSTSFKINSLTHPGPRENLEDAAMSIRLEGMIPIQDDKTILTLADGVGGCNKGEIASQLAVRTIANFLISYFNTSDDISGQVSQSPAEIIAAMKSAFAQANDQIIRKATGEYKGMATTVVCGIIVDHILYVGWVGDSRLYHFRNEKLFRRTNDHSLVQEALDREELLPEETHNVSYAHTITRYLGGHPDKGTPAIQISPVRPGDIIILCSDGLTDVISDNKITEAIRSCMTGELPFAELPFYLVNQALMAGTQDNVTVLCAQILSDMNSDYYENVPSLTCTGAYSVAAAQVLSIFIKES